jgi:tetratricopeptide (TPR) repeat protein
LERCLALTKSASAYANLAFCHHLMGHYDTAIDIYHQSLSKNPEDPFCSEMLHRCLSDALESSCDANNYLLGEHPADTIATTATAAAVVGSNTIHTPVANANANSTPRSRRDDPSTSLWTEDGFDENESSSHTTSDVEMG